MMMNDEGVRERERKRRCTYKNMFVNARKRITFFFLLFSPRNSAGCWVSIGAILYRSKSSLSLVSIDRLRCTHAFLMDEQADYAITADIQTDIRERGSSRIEEGKGKTKGHRGIHIAERLIKRGVANDVQSRAI